MIRGLLECEVNVMGMKNGASILLPSVRGGDADSHETANNR